MPDSAHCLLADFAVVRFRGADAAKFLQGQLSNDLDRLAEGSIMRAGLHNPQGRAQALLWLAATAGDILALLPRELAPPVTAQLRRYLLRAKLTITDESEQWQVLGRWQSEASGPEPGGAWRLDAERSVTLLASGTPVPAGEAITREQWRALDVAQGLPQIYAATSGQFVAQMLNLDCIDAISFEKGCYTGQEVIARAHFRGRVKRRMQRFETLAAAQLAPGDSGQLADGRSFRVVESVTRRDGSSEFLAVTALTATAREFELDGGAPGQAASPVSAAPLPTRALSLPYRLPE